MTVQDLERQLVDGWLQYVRIPLSAFEAVTGKRGEETWPPALAFGGFEATVRQQLGGLLGAPALVEQGRLQAAKIVQLRRATTLEAQAEATREQAEQDRLQRERALAEKAERVQREQQAKEAEIERTTRQREQQVEQRAAEQRQQARKADAVAEKAVEANERKARRTALSADAKALAEREEAVAGQAEVLQLDDRIQASKARRSS